MELHTLGKEAIRTRRVCINYSLLKPLSLDPDPNRTTGKSTRNELDGARGTQSGWVPFVSISTYYWRLWLGLTSWIPRPFVRVAPKMAVYFGPKKNENIHISFSLLLYVYICTRWCMSRLLYEECCLRELVRRWAVEVAQNGTRG